MTVTRTTAENKFVRGDSMNIPRPSSIAIAISLLLLASAQKSFACGLDWKVPKNHFDGVNERGNLSYWEKVGDVHLNETTNVPLVIGFNSARTSTSPYLGDGWTLPFLESNVVQVDSKRFLMMLPDGENVRFKRKDETSQILQGQGGWMAQLDQNSFTVWATCGWKIVFNEGKISSITTPRNEQITYLYKNGVVTEVDEGSKPLLTVFDNAKGSVSGLTFNGTRVDFEQGQKPNVESIGGQTVIGNMSSSLDKVTMSGGKIENYKFAVDPKLVPTLVISGVNNRTFSWDPFTKLILKDGDWSYKITPGTKPFANAEIERSSLNKPLQTEYYYNDNTTGVTTEQGLNGVRLVTQRFIEPGPLYERVRTVTEIKNGSTTILSHCDYDELGRLLRKSDAQGQTTTYSYDDSGRLSLVKFPDGRSICYSYDKNGESIGKVELSDAQKKALLVQLKQLQDAFVLAIGLKAKSQAALQLGLFYVNSLGNVDNARKLAEDVLDPKTKFTILLQSYDHDMSLGPADKIKYYKTLLEMYPANKKLLEQLIQLRTSEEQNEANQ